MLLKHFWRKFIGAGKDFLTRPPVNVGISVIYLYFAESHFPTRITVSVEGKNLGDGFIVKSEDRVARIMSEKWILADDGSHYNRDSIMAYKVEHLDHWVEG